MTRRRLLVWAGIVLLAPVVALACRLALPDPISLIKPGMGMAEVEAAFGEPGLKFASEPTDKEGILKFYYRWKSGRRSVHVEFLAVSNGPRTDVACTTGKVRVFQDDSFLNRLRAWLGR